MVSLDLAPAQAQDAATQEQRATETAQDAATDETLAAGAVSAVVRGGLSAVEACAVRVELAAYTATVDGAPSLTPGVLAYMMRHVFVTGDTVMYPRLAGRDWQILPVSYWYVTGGVMPATWRYDLQLYGPTFAANLDRGYDAVIHLMRAPDRNQPWCGTSSLTRASLTYRLATMVEASLVRESRIPASGLVPMPQGLKQATANRIKAMLQSESLPVALPTTTQAGLGAGRTGAPQTDWKQHRVGPEPPQAMIDLANQASAKVCAALGVSPALIGEGENTGASREARRQFQTDVLQPLGALVSAECSRFFGHTVTVRWPVRSDVLMIQAKALDTLIKAGYDKTEAARMVGF